MNLRYIYLGSDDSFSTDFEDIFTYNTRFISNWMSKNVRKLKIPTDGTFNHINVCISLNESKCIVVSPSILEVTIQWTKKDYLDYLSLKDVSKRVVLYLQILSEGLHIAAQFKNIHIGDLNNLIDDFRNNGYKNEWLFKSLQIKNYGIKLKIMCHFTTYDFNVKVYLWDNSGELLAEKVVFRIYPDEVFFSRLFRKISLDDVNLYINNFLDKHTMSFDLQDLSHGIINETLLYDAIKQYAYNPHEEKYKKIQWETPIAIVH